MPEITSEGITIGQLLPASSADVLQSMVVEKDGEYYRLSLGQLSTMIVSIITSGAPVTLDTLNELAAALGDDPNFAASTASALGGRLQKSQNLSDLEDHALARLNLSLPPNFVASSIMVRNAANNGFDLKSAAQTKSFVDAHEPDFLSSELGVGTDSLVTIPHGFGAVPKDWTVVLRCKTINLGYPVGVEIKVGSHVTHSGQADQGAVAAVDATNIYIVQGASLTLLSMSTFDNSPITPGSWRWVARAWK